MRRDRKDRAKSACLPASLETVCPGLGVAAGTTIGKFGASFLTWFSSFPGQPLFSCSLAMRGAAWQELGSFTLHVAFLTRDSEFHRAYREFSCPHSSESPPDLWNRAEAAQATPGSLGGGHSWDRILRQEPGTGAEAARKSVPFPPRSFCALLTASSHLPSCLPLLLRWLQVGP